MYRLTRPYPCRDDSIEFDSTRLTQLATHTALRFGRAYREF